MIVLKPLNVAIEGQPNPRHEKNNNNENRISECFPTMVDAYYDRGDQPLFFFLILPLRLGA